MLSMLNIVWKSDSTPLVMSPFEVYAYGYASCTGHAITVAAALRSVGVPSRVSGTIWNATCVQGHPVNQTAGDNHSWIETWNNGDWSFCDANSCANGLNNTWFYGKDTNCANSDNKNHTIWATSYQMTSNGNYYVMPWAFGDTTVNAWDVTSNYHKNMTNNKDL